MMKLADHLRALWRGVTDPFLCHDGTFYSVEDILGAAPDGFAQLAPGDVLAVAGDYQPWALAGVIAALDAGVSVALLDAAEGERRNAALDTVGARWLLEGGMLTSRMAGAGQPALLRELTARGGVGLVFFSSGTTGAPKAILHDAETFFAPYFEKRRPFRTMTLLAFDHLAGFNALMRALFNRGFLVTLNDRNVATVLDEARTHALDLLPATPTFLRLLWLSDALQDWPPSLKTVSYGSERMDQLALSALCQALPDVDFRQTYGVSELGALRLETEARDSLGLRFADSDVQYRIGEQGSLEIKTPRRMLGYLNAPDPFLDGGWYDTGDLVESRNSWLYFKGRVGDVINVAGLKCLPIDIENAAMEFDGVASARAYGKNNPISGQHVELDVTPGTAVELDISALKAFLAQRLPNHMRPRRIRLNGVAAGRRMKRQD